VSAGRTIPNGAEPHKADRRRQVDENDCCHTWFHLTDIGVLKPPGAQSRGLSQRSATLVDAKSSMQWNQPMTIVLIAVSGNMTDLL
jgi:hypothetical protein